MTVDLITALKTIRGVEAVREHDGALWAEGALLDVESMGAAMAALGIRLGTITATPRAGDGETTVIYHYIDERKVINFKTQTRNGVLTSLAPMVRAAAWAEREIKDLFAVDFPGHPNLVPLLRPEGFEAGMFRAAMCARPVMAKSPASPLARK
ncbi:MAG TPA: NADH-quinone oxidoreductase subunit C [Azospirillum sp.]|nr:NADH-quinone oxidoreductase subunit C [Azospirillum sp.]